MLLEIQGFTISVTPGAVIDTRTTGVEPETRVSKPIYTAEITHGNADARGRSNESAVAAAGQVIAQLFQKQLIHHCTDAAISPYMNKDVTIWTSSGERLIGKLRLTDGERKLDPYVVETVTYKPEAFGTFSYTHVAPKEIVSITSR